jgi:hypothetical protein
MKYMCARNFFLLSFLIFLLYITPGFSANFEELDKPPEGMYKGQMIIGGFASIGVAKGTAVDAENTFVRGSTYTFSDSETTKALWINHLSYSFGVFGEYCIIDYVGVGAKAGYSSVIQRTNFGKDYANKSAVLMEDYFLLFGPVFHATTRRPWDISLSPMIGFSYGTFKATPIADKMISTYDPGNTKGKTSFITYGAELKLSLFFSGGFVLSLGGEWIRNGVKLDGAVTQNNPQTGRSYMNGGTSGNIDNVRISIGGGYAFKN